MSYGCYSSIDLDTETIVGISEAGKHFPGPRPPARGTFFRWIKDGIRVPGVADPVKLDSIELNGRRYTSVEAIRRFVRALNSRPQVIAPETLRQAQTANAERILEASGF